MTINLPQQAADELTDADLADDQELRSLEKDDSRASPLENLHDARRPFELEGLTDTLFITLPETNEEDDEDEQDFYGEGRPAITAGHLEQDGVNGNEVAGAQANKEALPFPLPLEEMIEEQKANYRLGIPSRTEGNLHLWINH